MDDFLKKIHWRTDKQRKFTDAQVLTTTLIAAGCFQGNYIKALDFLVCYEGFYRIDKGVFSKRLKQLRSIIFLVFNYLAEAIKSLNLSANYISDTFPVSVCRNIRIPRCQLLQGEDYRGYNSSKKEYFYGFKVQVITTQEGIPVQLDIFCGNTGDITAFQCSQSCLPEGSHLYADKAYNDYDYKDWMLQEDGIHLQSIRKANSNRTDLPATQFLKEQLRKKIENTFAGITDLFPRHIHATNVEGFLTKIFLFVLAFTFFFIGYNLS